MRAEGSGAGAAALALLGVRRGAVGAGCCSRRRQRGRARCPRGRRGQGGGGVEGHGQAHWRDDRQRAPNGTAAPPAQRDQGGATRSLVRRASLTRAKRTRSSPRRRTRISYGSLRGARARLTSRAVADERAVDVDAVVAAGGDLEHSLARGHFVAVAQRGLDGRMGLLLLSPSTLGSSTVGSGAGAAVGCGGPTLGLGLRRGEPTGAGGRRGRILAVPREAGADGEDDTGDGEEGPHGAGVLGAVLLGRRGLGVDGDVGRGLADDSRGGLVVAGDDRRGRGQRARALGRRGHDRRRREGAERDEGLGDDRGRRGVGRLGDGRDDGRGRRGRRRRRPGSRARGGRDRRRGRGAGERGAASAGGGGAERRRGGAGATGGLGGTARQVRPWGWGCARGAGPGVWRLGRVARGAGTMTGAMRSAAADVVAGRAEGERAKGAVWTGSGRGAGGATGAGGASATGVRAVSGAGAGAAGASAAAGAGAGAAGASAAAGAGEGATGRARPGRPGWAQQEPRRRPGPGCRGRPAPGCWCG
jgi:hypothetical protein